MKNVVSIVVAVVLVILVIVAVFYNFILKTNKEADVYYEDIIERIINEEKETAKKREELDDKSDFKTFYYIDKYGMEKQDTKVYLYAFVHVENYHKNSEGKVKMHSGYAMPHRFEFENGEFVEKKVPADGSYYESSLNELYPLAMRMKLDLTKDNEKSKENIKKQVEEYYSISYDEVVF